MKVLSIVVLTGIFSMAGQQLYHHATSEYTEILYGSDVYECYEFEGQWAATILGISDRIACGRKEES